MSGQPSDHDLLLRIDERVRTIKDDIEELKVALSQQYERIERLERWRAYVLGFAGAIALVVSVLMGVVL